MFRNVAAVEIGELRDALSYAEHLLAQTLTEKEALMKNENAYFFKKISKEIRKSN